MDEQIKPIVSPTVAVSQLIKFSKNDFLASLIIGELCAWLILAMLRALEINIPFSTYLPVVFPVLCVISLYVAYLIAQKIAVVYQVAKFILVGGFNTLVDWGILAVLIFFFRNYLFIHAEDAFLNLGILTIAYYSLFKSISFIVAGTNSYFWNKFWTFKREATEGMAKEFMQFLLVTFIGFLINVGIASVIFNYVSPLASLTGDQWGIAAAVVATVFSMVWNFIGYKFIVFDVKRDTDTPIARG
jgi:putative flippase GtrA